MDRAEERFNKILIKLQRRYGKDELVQSLNKTISELRVEVGQLKSYIDEIEDSHSEVLKKEKIKYKNEVNAFKQTFGNQAALEAKKMAIVRKLTDENTKLKKENKRKTETISELVTKLAKYGNSK